MAKTTHGLSWHPLYPTYNGILQRCNNPKSQLYKWYGARGISVCKEWVDDISKFLNYVASLENFEVDGLSIDRINNDGNYEPGNLRWATRKQQSANSRPQSTHGRKPGKGQAPITPFRMPLDLKERAKERAEECGMTLSRYVCELIKSSI